MGKGLLSHLEITEHTATVSSLPVTLEDNLWNPGHKAHTTNLRVYFDTKYCSPGVILFEHQTQGQYEVIHGQTEAQQTDFHVL